MLSMTLWHVLAHECLHLMRAVTTGSTDWTDFKEESAGAYLGLSPQALARRKLVSLTKKAGLLKAYISEFQRNLTHLTDWTKWLICQMSRVPLKLNDVGCQLTSFLSKTDKLVARQCLR